MEQIIISLITAGIPAVVTLITNHSTRKTEAMHNAKQSLFQMILEDKMRVMEGHLPENYQAIHHEFDIYKKELTKAEIISSLENHIDGKVYTNALKGEVSALKNEIYKRNSEI